MRGINKLDEDLDKERFLIKHLIKSEKKAKQLTKKSLVKWEALEIDKNDHSHQRKIKFSKNSIHI